MAIKSYKKEIVALETAAKEAGYVYYRGMHPAEELKLLTEAFREIRKLRGLASLDNMVRAEL